MYLDFFNISEPPFSIVASPHFLYLSRRHQEAITQLTSGLSDGGGFALLTGEVGTGKTTVANAMLTQAGAQTTTAFLFNPTFSVHELLEALCDEFGLAYEQGAGLKVLHQHLVRFLWAEEALGRRVWVAIDEAQHLSVEALEQLRLLTNLETQTHKLLTILLIGQPELQALLQQPHLRQLAQRITGRYHLLPLTGQETREYIQFRWQQAGGKSDVFSAAVCRYIARVTQGIPRLINLVCDAALKQAYHNAQNTLTMVSVKQAAQHVLSFQAQVYQTVAATRSGNTQSLYLNFLALGLGLLLAFGCNWLVPQWMAQLVNFADTQSMDGSLQEETAFSLALPQELAALAHTSKERSIADLYALWGYQASINEQLCVPQNQFTRLNCVLLSGDRSTLLTHNLPVVLVLTLPDSSSANTSTTGYAVLYRWHDSEVELLFAGQRIQVPYQWLSQYWQGDYYLAWQPWFNHTLKRGMKGASVVLLDQKLSQLLAEPLGEQDYFDAQLERKVRVFQRWRQLSEDGIAGQSTLQQLEWLTQPVSLLQESIQ